MKKSLNSNNCALTPENLEVLARKSGKPEDVKAILKRTQKGNLISSIDNCVKILECDQKFAGKLKYNELTGFIDITGHVGWSRQKTSISDSDISNMRLYIESTYELSTNSKLDDALRIVAEKNAYHPILDMLRSLKWDGINRIDSLFKRFLGAEDNKYNAEISHLLLNSMLKRIYFPGCKYDYLICFVGQQGIGKSSIFRYLAQKDEWFSDDLNNLGTRNVREELSGHWIIEMSEMLATSSAKSIEEIKSFLTRTKDTYRIPYDKFPHDFQRQCIFVGTTNNMDFLPQDRTGNRRFIPVICDSSKVERKVNQNEAETRAYLKQVLAEAVHNFNLLEDREHLPLVLSEETERYVESLRKECTPVDINAALIKNWLEKTMPEYICISMVLREVFDKSNAKPFEIREISQILDAMPETKRLTSHRFKEYGTQRGWKYSPISNDSLSPISEVDDVPFL